MKDAKRSPLRHEMMMKILAKILGWA